MSSTLVRAMLPEERVLVLSDWKRSLAEQREPVIADWSIELADDAQWMRTLRWPEWWALINHVVDRISLPSSTVWMICHVDEPAIPLGWVAVREGVILHLNARASVREEPAVAAVLERSLLDHAEPLKDREHSYFNPFVELKRP